MSEGPTQPAPAEEAGAVATAMPEAAPPVKPKRRMKRSTRTALLVILVVAVIAAVVITVIYFINGSKYVSTDNAQIDGDKISVNAPTGGTLVGWTAKQGSTLVRNQTVGRIRIQGGFVQPQQAIKAPADATVVVDNGVEGAYVPAGTQLAVAYDFSKIFVTARVDETSIDDVHTGEPVDISVDAFPGVGLVGTVVEVQGGAAGEFSAIPQSNTSGNFQKVTQVIPVKIAIADMKNLQLVPGMNVTASIHKES
jgi:multidrug resistance efflux pump